MSIAAITERIIKAFNIANAFKTVSIQEDAFINGNAFTHSDYDLDVATDEINNFLFDPTRCDCSQIIAEVPVFNATAGPISIEYFVGTTVSDPGTQLFVFNRRATSTNVPKAKLYLTPTITADGVRIAGQLVPSTGVPIASGDNSLPGLPFEVDKTLLLLIRVTNTNGAGVALGRRFDWIEV